MSSYLSKPFEPTEVKSNVNVPLTLKVLDMKQGRYDVAKTQIQQTLDAYGQMMALRPEDNEYIAAKLNDITTQINESGNLDLSQSNVADSLIGKVKSVARDPFIVNAMEQTAKYKNYQKEIANIKEKKPDFYNDRNYEFGLAQAGFEDYMTGKTTKMGSLNYIPYTDVTKQALEKVKQLKELRGEQTIETAEMDSNGQPTGRKIKRTIKGLSEDEIFQYFPTLLTSEEDRQLTIDGYAKYKNNMAQGKIEFGQYKDKKLQLVGEAIEHENTIINNTANSEKDRTEAKERLKSYKNQKSSIEQALGEINTNDPIQLGSFLNKQNFKNSIAEIAQAKWSTELQSDDYYFDKQKLELDINKDQREAEKQVLELAKLQKELGVDAQGKPIVNTSAISISAKEGELAESIHPVESLKSDYNNVYNSMVATVRDSYQSDKTTPEMKAQFKSEMNRMGYDENGTIVNQKLASSTSKASAMKLAFEKSGMNYIHADKAKYLANQEVKRSALANEFGSAQITGLAEAYNKDPKEYVKVFKQELIDASVYAQGEQDLAILPGSAEAITVAQEAVSNTQKFIAKIGGIDKLESYLQKDPKNVEEFSNVLDSLQKRPRNFQIYNSLSDEGKKIANDKLIQRTKEGKNVYFNTAEIATITDEKIRTTVVNMLPQDADTQLFNPKNPMSFFKNPDGSITITQNKGYTEGKESLMKKDATITVDSKDAPYQELLKYVDLTEKDRGLNAEHTTVKIRPTVSPTYIDGNKKLILGKVDETMTGISPQIKKSLFLSDPSNYVTESRTKDIYKTALKGKFSDADIDVFVEQLSDKMAGFKLELKPYDNQWAISLKKPDGSVLYEGGTGMKYLEEDMTYLTQNYPQTIISDWILRYIIENPKNVNNILN